MSDHRRQQGPVRHPPDDVARGNVVGDLKAVAPLPDEAAPNLDRGSDVQLSIWLPTLFDATLDSLVHVANRARAAITLPLRAASPSASKARFRSSTAESWLCEAAFTMAVLP